MGSVSDQGGGCGWVEVTRDMMARAATCPSGEGYIGKQLNVLTEIGVDGTKKGWLTSMVGMMVPIDLWNRFVAAGNNRREKRYKEAGVDISAGPVMFQATQERNRRNMDKMRTVRLHLKKVPQQPAQPEMLVHEKSSFVPRDLREELFSDPMYKVVRAAVLRRAPWCSMCGRRPPHVVLNVDHIIPLTVNWERRMDPNNLQVLCADCNQGKSNYWT